MVYEFEESESLIPRIAFIALTLVFTATSVFMLICTQLDLGIGILEAASVITVFAVVVLVSYVVKLRIAVEDEVLTVRMIRKYRIPFSDIIDTKTGDIDVIRNYSGWGLKNVKFKNLICSGYEFGISIKLIGKKVMTISTSRPDELAALLHTDAEEPQ
jgi:hypothetical protein